MSPQLVSVRRQIGRAVFVFSSRQGGVSSPPYASLNLGLHVGDSAAAVRENRRRLLAHLEVASWPMVEAEQVHGAGVAIVTQAWLKQHAGTQLVAPAADALVTSEAGVVLALFFADCVPIFLAERMGRVIGLVHAGWRGTAARVGRRTVAVIHSEFGIDPSDLHAVIGPCVGMCCYDVREDVAQAVLEAVPGKMRVAGVARKGEIPGQWFVDLAQANVAQLQNARLDPQGIEITGPCTCCRRDVFFTVRGDGRTTGRCGALAYIRK